METKCPLADKWTKMLNTHTHTHICREASHMPLVVKNPLANAGDIRDVVSIPEL